MTGSAEPKSVVVAGAGVFGAAAAVALRRRGHEVTVVDPGPLPAPLAASTDISKVIRREYGSDRFYRDLGTRAIEGWRRWNREWGATLYHEVGILLLAGRTMAPGSFEEESFEALREVGCAPERLDAAAVRHRFPAWRAEHFGDGFFHPVAGYAESGRVVARLVAEGREVGVRFQEGEGLADLLAGEARVEGLRTTAGRELRGDVTLVAAGCWTGHLLGLEWGMWATGHPVFHLRPDDPEPFRAARFPVFTADIATTGWYGFPVSRDGVVKVARHARGVRLHPDAPREVRGEDRSALRDFLAGALPGLAAAPVVYERLCPYCDTADGHFWIDRDLDRPGLVVAAGGSGHGFKFAPLLGELIAGVVEGEPPPERFRWRREPRPYEGEEEARARGVG